MALLRIFQLPDAADAANADVKLHGLVLSASALQSLAHLSANAKDAAQDHHVDVAAEVATITTVNAPLDTPLLNHRAVRSPRRID